MCDLSRKTVNISAFHQDRRRVLLVRRVRYTVCCSINENHTEHDGSTDSVGGVFLYAGCWHLSVVLLQSICAYRNSDSQSIGASCNSGVISFRKIFFPFTTIVFMYQS